MNGAFYIGAIGLESQQQALDVVANNIGNMNTLGYKRSNARFSELMRVSPQRTAIEARDVHERSLATPAGVSMSGTSRVWTEGALRQTGRALDLSIDGPGFVELLGEGGRSLLWRGGALKINADGYLASSDDLPLRSMISVPLDATDLKIARDGTVSIQNGDKGDRETIGKIDLVVAKDPDALSTFGRGLYEATDQSLLYAADGDEDGAGAFVQGALEGSNVDLSDEMVTLLLLQRAYAANAQVVHRANRV